MTTLPKKISFRQRLAAQDGMLGTFIKSPGVQAIEVLGDVGLDFVVIDAEHAPFERGDIDVAVLAAKAAGIDALVRVESISTILTALDCGATGVMVPHVFSAQVAQSVVDACRYRPGRRGFTTSSRAGRYGRLGLTSHLEESDRNTAIIAMLEDPEALDNIDGIVAVDGIDAFFLGRGDLTVALGEVSADAASVRNAISLLSKAVTARKKTLCAFIGTISEVVALRELGVTTFIISSEQGLLRQAATSEMSKFLALST